MKIKQLFILCVFATSLGQSASGQATFGEPNCGQWVSRKREPDKAWLLGYLSGVNAAMSSEKNDRLSKLNSAEQIFLWMDNYCAKNPLKSVQDGGNELFYELRTK